MEEAVTEREMNNIEQIERFKMTYEANISQLKAKNQELTEKCENLSDKNKYYEKEFKNERFSKESIE
jgi:cell division protein FtsB